MTSSIYTMFLNRMSQEYIKNNSNVRIVLDYISGMTDAYFNKQFSEIFLPKSFGMNLN